MAHIPRQRAVLSRYGAYPAATGRYPWIRRISRDNGPYPRTTAHCPLIWLISRDNGPLSPDNGPLAPYIRPAAPKRAEGLEPRAQPQICAAKAPSLLSAIDAGPATSVNNLVLREQQPGNPRKGRSGFIENSTTPGGGPPSRGSRSDRSRAIAGGPLGRRTGPGPWAAARPAAPGRICQGGCRGSPRCGRAPPPLLPRSQSPARCLCGAPTPEFRIPFAEGSLSPGWAGGWYGGGQEGIFQRHRPETWVTDWTGDLGDLLAAGLRQLWGDGLALSLIHAVRPHRIPT